MASRSGKKTFVCPYCGAPGFNKSRLRQHVIALHPEFLKSFKDLLRTL